MYDNHPVVLVCLVVLLFLSLSSYKLRDISLPMLDILRIALVNLRAGICANCMV